MATLQGGIVQCSATFEAATTLNRKEQPVIARARRGLGA
jgi:hypothetical protein